MSRYEEGMKIIEETCGNYKDNVISLSTIALEPNAEGQPSPAVREVDGYYEDGTFYVTTWAKSDKMQQIEKNSEVAVSVGMEGIYGTGTGENLGWVLKPENAEIREKVRKAFSDWYDHANNEQDENCVLLSVKLKKVTIFRDHGAVRYALDIVNKSEIK